MSLSWSTREGCTIGPTSWPCAGAATRRGTGTCVRNFFCGCEKFTLIGPSEKSGGFFLVANVQMFTCTPVQCTNVHLNGCTLNGCTLNKCSPEQMFSERMFMVNGRTLNKCTLNKCSAVQMFTMNKCSACTDVHRTNVQRVPLYTVQIYIVFHLALVGWLVDHFPRATRLSATIGTCKSRSLYTQKILV